MTAPRVLQVALSLDPGGTERLVLDLATRLHPEVPMRVCCLDRAGSWAPDLEARGIGVDVLHRAPGFRPSLSWALARILGRHRIQVVHAHHYTPFVYAAFARLVHPGIPIVFTEHGRLSDAPPSQKRRLVNRALAPLATRVFAVSSDLRRHMAGEGFSPDAIGVITNGITVGPLPDAATRSAVRRDLGVAEDVVVVGTIARLDPVKDLGRLISAVAHVNRDGRGRLLLAIVGDGTEREALERLVQELNASADVRFLGHRDDARRWLAGFEIYVNCSTSEGVSLTILEAMAAGAAIVATAVGGTPEIIDDTCARLVPARDEQSLAAALLDLASRPDVRATLGAAARHRVENRFTIERMVQAYRDIYQEVA